MQTEKQNKPHIPQFIWVILLLMAVALVYLFWQNQQLKTVEPVVQAESQPQQPANRVTTPSRIADRGKKPNIKGVLKERKKMVAEMTPEQTGLRMFDELKTVTGDDPELLEAIMERLVEESATQKELETQLAAGDLTEAEFWDEVEQMRMETEEFAEALLEPLQFDRYREVRQSWAKGRIHPDRDSRE